MNNPTLIQQLFQEFVANGGTPQITSFRTHLEVLMKNEIKPLCGSSRRLAPGSHDWRDDLNARFEGRGSKWQFVSLDEIESTLDRFDEEGIDTTDYRDWTQSQGKAWIRYLKPRIVNGQNVAAFTVHTHGSTIFQPHQLHFIPVNRLDELCTPLNGTPFSLKLEESNAISNEDPIDEVQNTEVDEDDLIG
jgi:hypothetical protein